jgi:hypothetical protein
MFAYDQAFSLRCLRRPLRYPSVLVVGDHPLHRHYWANGLRQGFEHLGQHATLRCLDQQLCRADSLGSESLLAQSGGGLPSSSLRPAMWGGDTIDLLEVMQPIEEIPASLIRSSLVVLLVSGNAAGLKHCYRWIKHCFIHYQKQRFYLLGDAPTPKGGSICDHLIEVTQRFLPAVQLVSLSHLSDRGEAVVFKSSTSVSLYIRVFRQLAFMLYDSVILESAPSEVPNRMRKESYVSSC